MDHHTTGSTERAERTSHSNAYPVPSEPSGIVAGVARGKPRSRSRNPWGKLRMKAPEAGNGIYVDLHALRPDLGLSSTAW